MLITLACAAMTVIFFIVSQVSGPCRVGVGCPWRCASALHRRFQKAAEGAPRPRPVCSLEEQEVAA